MLRFACLIVLLSCLAPLARAEEFIRPNWPDLARTLIRFNAVDAADDKIIDDYAVITECDMYQAFHENDFKWNKVRGAIRENIRNHAAAFPAAYGYVQPVDLERYDFNTKLFRLSDKTPIRNVNAFRLFKIEGTGCGLLKLKRIPALYRAVLETPLYIPGLPLTADQAADLLARMKADGNDHRQVFARFNLRVVYVEPMVENPAIGRFTNVLPQQRGHTPGEPMQIDTRLDSVDFFEDPELTRLIYSFRP